MEEQNIEVLQHHYLLFFLTLNTFPVNSQQYNITFCMDIGICGVCNRNNLWYRSVNCVFTPSSIFCPDCGRPIHVTEDSNVYIGWIKKAAHKIWLVLDRYRYWKRTKQTKKFMENTGEAAATDVIIFVLYVLWTVINSVFCLYTFNFVSLLPVCIY